MVSSQLGDILGNHLTIESGVTGDVKNHAHQVGDELLFRTFIIHVGQVHIVNLLDDCLSLALR